MEIKSKKKLSPNEMKSKIGVIEAMRDMAASQMGDKLKGLKKVTVASSDKEGLEKGLDKAKELIAAKPDGIEGLADSDEADENSLDNSGSDETSDLDGLSEEEIDAKLAQLVALKAKLEARKA